MKNITLRRATAFDARLFYDARFNDIANISSRIKTIPKYSEHHIWYRMNHLNNIFVIVLDDYKIGYIRIDNLNEMSIAVLPQYHNKGYATKALEIFTSQFKDLNATIYKSNISSQRLFKKFPNISVKLIED